MTANLSDQIRASQGSTLAPFSKVLDLLYRLWICLSRIVHSEVERGVSLLAWRLGDLRQQGTQEKDREGRKQRTFVVCMQLAPSRCFINAIPYEFLSL